MPTADLPGDSLTDSEDKPLAWITGAGGLIGGYVSRSASQFGSAWKVRCLAREHLNLLDDGTVRRAFADNSPRLLIHCAALSQTQACQSNPAQARKLNVELTSLLSNLTADIPFVFFSTDLVFDGSKGNYVESDAVNPLSVYAETKVAAEQIVLANPRHTVIRTSLNGGISPAGDRGFNEQLRRAFERGESVKLFTDEYRAPIHARVTAQAVWELALKAPPGLYHVAGSERLSRWEIGQLVAGRWPQLQPRLEAETLANYKGAPRPPDTSLNCAKAQRILSFPLPGMTGWLRSHPDEPF